MERVLEPELMVDDDQALAYSNADFTEPHQAAITRFRERFPDFRSGRVLDLACGPADVTVRFARAYPDCTVVGVEGSPAMLALGVQRVEAVGLQSRVVLAHRMLPDPELSELGGFDAVVCTSSLHHFHDPMVLWDAVRTAGAPGACVLVQDLYRPESPAAAQAFVDTYSAGEPVVLRRDYFNSLCAAFSPDEVAAQLRAAGFGGWAVDTVDDRHLVVSGRIP